MASPSGCNPPARACRFNSCPTRSKKGDATLFAGPFDFWRGRRSFKPARWDRNPYGLLVRNGVRPLFNNESQPTQRHDLRHGCCVRAGNATRSEIENGSALYWPGGGTADTPGSEPGAPPGVRVQIPPWSLWKIDSPGSSNGRTADSEPAGVGSTPTPGA